MYGSYGMMRAERQRSSWTKYRPQAHPAGLPTGKEMWGKTPRQRTRMKTILVNILIIGTFATVLILTGATGPLPVAAAFAGAAVVHVLATAILKEKEENVPETKEIPLPERLSRNASRIEKEFPQYTETSFFTAEIYAFLKKRSALLKVVRLSGGSNAEYIESASAEVEAYLLELEQTFRIKAISLNAMDDDDPQAEDLAKDLKNLTHRAKRMVDEYSGFLAEASRLKDTDDAPSLKRSVDRLKKVREESSVSNEEGELFVTSPGTGMGI